MPEAVTWPSPVINREPVIPESPSLWPVTLKVSNWDDNPSLDVVWSCPEAVSCTTILVKLPIDEEAYKSPLALIKPDADTSFAKYALSA